MEAAGLGLFMLSAGAFTVLFYHPRSAAAQGLEPPILRRCLMGLAMGRTDGRGPDLFAEGPPLRRLREPGPDPHLWRPGKIAGWDAACFG